MSTEKVRSTKLKFKGDKTKKKRKRDYDDEGRAGNGKRREEEQDPETWVFPEDASEIRGPTFIFHPSDPSPISINYNATANRLVLQVLGKEKLEDGDEEPSLLERTPTDVSQVWVVTRIAGSPTINLRTGTGEGKFLSCDTHGLVSTDRDARGPQEEWTPVLLPDGMVAFMNIYEKYLSMDEAAGGILQLRGDSEEVGFRERFWVKVQYKYKKEANEEEKKKKNVAVVEPDMDEGNLNRAYQAWGAGRLVVSTEDKKELKRARKEGRLAEAMLDRRAKLKRCGEHELKDYMGISQSDFSLFKTVVEQYALGGLPCVARTRQKPEEWEIFVETINALLPQLGKYLGSWHITAYFSILRRTHAIQRKWREMHAERATHTSTPPLSLSAEKKRIKYVGKSPPGRRLISSPARESGPRRRTSAKSVPPSTQGGSQQSSSIPLTLVNYPAPCTTCGYCPPVPSSLSEKLRSFFTNTEDLLPVLFFIGVTHDRHLYMILNWTPADRAAFVNALNQNRVKATDKQRLIELLARRQVVSPSAVKTPVRSRRERPYDPIPKPLPDVERRLISAQVSLSELMQAMTIQDEQEFHEILQTIDTLYGEDDDQSGRDNQWWIQFFHKVYSRWPVMRLYQEAGPEQNNWAIKFYLRRKLAGGIGLSPDNTPTDNLTYGRETATRCRTMSPDIDSYPNPNVNQTLPYPGITLSTCPAHHPPDYRLVGPRLRHLLESHGSEELLPAFIAVGIKTDQALHSLSQLTRQDRIKSFNKETNIHLTDLQVFALQMILNKL
ncbi:hypothetical protein AX15_006354 [Amanita polypyramis BW_CC]|nr:hypothetical protein AX15_006354 [Amanita polypyramis BW_CC]